MKKKILMIVGAALCAVLLVAGSVVGTLAYLTSTMKVTNTFTVGDVTIDLDESLVDLDGTPIENASRVHQNEYHLVPGTTYTKDPRITIKTGSEACFLFVKVENGLSAVAMTALEAQSLGKKTIATQMQENGWRLLTGTTDIYYFDAVNAASGAENASVVMVEDSNNDSTGAVAKSANTIYVEIFKEFTVSPSANLDLLEDSDGNGKVDPKIEITAYAVQGTFASPSAAWTATFGATTTPETTESVQ